MVLAVTQGQRNRSADKKVLFSRHLFKQTVDPICGIGDKDDFWQPFTLTLPLLPCRLDEDLRRVGRVPNQTAKSIRRPTNNYLLLHCRLA